MADISKITLPSGNTYDIKDAVARAAIAGGVSFIIAWDGTSTPVVADIPAGVVVKYNNVDYTGTLSADNAVVGAFYLVKSATQIGLDVYDEYVPVGTAPKSWEKIGDTQLNLTDVVTDVSLSKQTDTVIGSDATFTVTQPTVALSTGATAGSGVISVATGITSVTQPTVALSAESSSATGRAQYVQSVNTTKISATASGTAVSATGDNVTALTGLGTPTTDNVLGEDTTFSVTQPTISLTANTSTDTGRITYVQAQGTATTTKLSASANGTAVNATGDNVTVLTGLGTPSTSNVASSVTPTTKKLVTTTITGVSGSNNITPVESRTKQTTVNGFTAATTENYDSSADILKGASVTNEVLILGAYKYGTQDTYSAGAPRASLAVPTAASSATRVATGAVATTDTNGADIVTDVAVGDTVAAVTGYASPTTDTVIGTASTFNVTEPTVTISSGSTGDVTVATGIGNATTRYLSAIADGAAVTPVTSGAGSDIVAAITDLGTPSTDTVIGTGSTFNVTDPTITISSGSTGDVTVATGGNTKYMAATASGTAVTPTTTNIKATASGANTAWNNKDEVTALTDATTITVTKGNS